MNRGSMRLFAVTVVAFLLMAANSGANANFEIRKTVECDKGMDVQSVLDRNLLGLPMELRLVGTCSSFEITQNDVSIFPLHDDACPGATVDGFILLTGALRIELRCIAVTGGEEDFAGIEATESKAVLEDVEIIGVDGTALQSTGHSSIGMIRGTIAGGTDVGVVVDSISLAFFEDTDIFDHRGRGVDVSEGSSVHFWGGSISDNDEAGVFVDTKSVVHMEGVEVSNNGRAGLDLNGASFADLHGVMLADNGRLGPGSGIIVRQNSSARISASTMTRNGTTGLALVEHSYANVRNATQITENVRRGIFLRADSGVSLASDTYVPTQGSLNAAIQCGDKESSAQFDPSSGLIGDIDCDDVEF